MKTTKLNYLWGFIIASVLSFPLNSFSKTGHSKLSLYQLQDKLRYQNASVDDLESAQKFKKYISQLDDKAIYKLLKKRYVTKGNFLRNKEKLSKVWSGIGACHVIEAPKNLHYEEYFVALHSNAKAKKRPSKLVKKNDPRYTKFDGLTTIREALEQRRSTAPINYYQHGIGCKDINKRLCFYERNEKLYKWGTTSKESKAAELLREALNDPTDPCGIADFFEDRESPVKRVGAATIPSDKRKTASLDTKRNNSGQVISVRNHSNMVATHDFSRCGYVVSQDAITDILNQINTELLGDVIKLPTASHLISEMPQIFCKHIGFSEGRGRNIPVGHKNHINPSPILKVGHEQFKLGLELGHSLTGALNRIKEQAETIILAEILIDDIQIRTEQVIEEAIDLAEASNDLENNVTLVNNRRIKKGSSRSTSTPTSPCQESIFKCLDNLSIADKVTLASGTLSMPPHLKQIQQDLDFYSSGGGFNANVITGSGVEHGVGLGVDGPIGAGQGNAGPGLPRSGPGPAGH